MLLARNGFEVLLVDRASFPSDTISTHILWPHGAETMKQWGLLGRLASTGVPPICRRMRFDVGPFALVGTIPDANDGDGGFCPRRPILDTLLLDAAVEAGVEVRQNFTVDDLIFEDAAVAGIQGHSGNGPRTSERARIVVGADGVHSFVARAVHAAEYDSRPVTACAYYSYFSGVDQDDIELYVRERCAFGGSPTHDDLHLVMVNWPTSQFPAVRDDIDGCVSRALSMAPDFAARVSAGRREEKWYGTAGVPGYFRKPYGKGWALVGDAGYNRDPITAQGISDAFVDATALSGAIAAGLSEPASFDAALSAYETARNDRVRPMYEFTSHLAELEPPPPPMQALFGALRGNQDATNAFLSAITGAIPLQEFMSDENLGRIMSGAKAAKV